MRISTRWLGVALLFGTMGCDLGTKELAARELRGEPPVEVVGEVLQLRYAENRDVGFSLLRWVDEPTRRVLLLALVPLAMAALGLLWWRRREGIPTIGHAGFALLVAGGLGNYLDRLTRGYVVDFIALPHYPVFNVADIAIVVGGVLLLWSSRSDRAISAEAR